MPQHDIPTIQEAARGRWRDILASLGGCDAELLDGKHHSCPRCGGQDRFRMIDESAGAVLCNQCFKKDNGDGIAALQWLTGDDFKSVAGKLADYLGVKPLKTKSGDPAENLEWQDWNSNSVPYFTAKRLTGHDPAAVEAALLAIGARRARYRNKYTVYALPVYGDSLDLDKPVGWVMVEAMGGKLPKYDKSGQVADHLKAKVTAGSKPGLVGRHAIERLATPGLVETVWKLEGVTDLIAAWIAVPEKLRDRHVVVTNANGAGEQPKWMASALARARPLVLHDADQSGEAGAKVWAKAITSHGVDTTIVRLPYEVVEHHGKDFRDWIGEGNGYDDLLALADRGDICRAAKEGAPDGDGEPEFPIQELILKRLGLEVLYEDRNNKVRVFSTKLRKSTTFEKLSKITKVDLVQACGPSAMQCISSDPDGQNHWSMADVREAIAIMAASCRGKSDDRGIGVWQGLDEHGGPGDSLILANDTEAARWNGERILKRVLHPRVDGIVIDFGQESDDWYQYDDLARYTAKAEESVAWREATIERAVDLFSRWRWRNEHDAHLVTGLVMATWVQTIWSWRPLVAVIGESGSGKSTLFETLGGRAGTAGMFGGLVLASSKSSEAGIRQGVGNTGRIILLDEFEHSKERQKVLDTFRASSRGDVVIKGTANQKGTKFRLQHIAWVSAIESGMKQQPDRNRFVKLNLLPAQKENRGKLVPPPASELVDLGLRLLACSLVVGMQARKLAVDLKANKIEGAESRAVETYAVPASILALAMDADKMAAQRLQERLMQGVIGEDADTEESDHQRLLEAIMDATIQCDHGQRFSVQQLLAQYVDSGVKFGESAKDLERHGIAFRKEEMAINRTLVSEVLLRGTEWESKRIDELLMRLPGAERRQVKFSGSPRRCIKLPLPRLSTDP